MSFKSLGWCFVFLGLVLTQPGCLVPGPCAVNLWYPGMSLWEIGDPKIGGGDGHSMESAVTIRNWDTMAEVIRLEGSLLRVDEVGGSMHGPELEQIKGKSFHLWRYVDRGTKSPRVFYFDVTHAVKKRKKAADNCNCQSLVAQKPKT